MPFKKFDADSQGAHPLKDAEKIFIGRTGELLFFVQNILKPQDSTHNIISISGQSGVGKSTLLTRFMDDACAIDFKDYCLTAFVNERQATPASVMEKIADQLLFAGEFARALKQYKETLHKLQNEREVTREAFWRKATTGVAGSLAKGVPVVGGMLEQGVGPVIGYLWDELHYRQLLKDAEQLEDPIENLTRAFVEELNEVATTPVTAGIHQTKRRRRVILFFDTFEQLAVEVAPWLLNYFLEADISNNVVLVVAGRDPIEQSTPDDPKRWLPYHDNGTIYSISLNSFTEDETRRYLAERGIIDPKRVDTIWRLSHGLPLYLAFLTSNPQGAVDPTADVVANFLRWIPKQEHIKRQLALDAALYSRPFNQDDLEAFTYLPEHERPTLYRWLTEQPFVQSSAQDGRYHYHILAQELFSRHLYQRSRKEYYAIRRALASYYQQQLAKVESEGGKEVYRSAEWLELALALIYQLFLLPDELSHIKSIEQVLSTYSRQEHTGEVVRALRDVSHKQPNNLASPSAQETAKHLLQYIEADLANHEQELLNAASFLLEKVVHTPSFPPELLAHIYSKRGHAYGSLKEYELAIADFNRTLELVPRNVRAYIMRGFTRVFMNKYRWAIEDFDRALELSPASSMAYWLRGISYSSLGDYQQAIADYDHALQLSPTSSMVYTKRGEAYSRLKEYERAIADYGRALKLNPKSAQTYTQRGETYRLLKEYDKAIADYDCAITLDPGDAWTYVCKGFIYLWLKDIRQAIINYTHARELNPTNVNYAWMIEWSAMCLKKPDSESAERLEAIAAHDPQCYEALVCRGTALWLRKRFEEVLVTLGQAIVLHQEEWYVYDAYFWKGMVCISLEQDKEALTAVEKALALDLPPILLTPLRWFEQERPHFYEKYTVPLLAHYEVF